MSNENNQGSQTRQPGSVQVKGNRLYLNSQVYKSANPNAPYSFFARWHVNNRGEKDVNTIRVVFFTAMQNHPIVTAQKGDIIRFEDGTLRFKTKQAAKKGDPETVEYAEILVHEQLSVERVAPRQESSNANQGNASIPAANAEPTPQQAAQAATPATPNAKAAGPIF